MLWCWHFNSLGCPGRDDCTVKKSGSNFSIHPYDLFAKHSINGFFMLHLAVIIELWLFHPKIWQVVETPAVAADNPKYCDFGLPSHHERR